MSNLLFQQVPDVTTGPPTEYVVLQKMLAAQRQHLASLQECNNELLEELKKKNEEIKKKDEQIKQLLKEREIIHEISNTFM